MSKKISEILRTRGTLRRTKPWTKWSKYSQFEQFFSVKNSLKPNSYTYGAYYSTKFQERVFILYILDLFQANPIFYIGSSSWTLYAKPLWACIYVSVFMLWNINNTKLFFLLYDIPPTLRVRICNVKYRYDLIIAFIQRNDQLLSILHIMIPNADRLSFTVFKTTKRI